MLLIACPLVILLNALVIVVIKTKRRLQTMSNILLASLAGADLAMGLTAQPAFIAKEISRLASRLHSVYGTLYDITPSVLVVLCLASIFHLVLISADRFVAIKCSLRYDTVVTKFRITIEVACSWLMAVTCAVINRPSSEIAQSGDNVRSDRRSHLFVSDYLLPWIGLFCLSSSLDRDQIWPTFPRGHCKVS